MRKERRWVKDKLKRNKESEGSNRKFLSGFVKKVFSKCKNFLGRVIEKLR